MTYDLVKKKDGDLSEQSDKLPLDRTPDINALTALSVKAVSGGVSFTDFIGLHLITTAAKGGRAMHCMGMPDQLKKDLEDAGFKVTLVMGTANTWRIDWSHVVV